MNRRALLTAACFLALAAVTAVVAGRTTNPPVTGLLVVAAATATLAGGAGIARRRAWPLALFLLPLGAYLLMRLQIAPPEGTSGASAQLSFYARHVAEGASRYVHERFPLDATAADLRLLLSLVVYATAGLAAFLALSLRRPLAGVIVLLCLAGFGFTTDEVARQPWDAVVFVVLAGGLLALSHARPRERVRAADAVAGGSTAVIAAVLALSILGVTTVEAGQPLRDWRDWDIAGPGTATLRFDWMQNYPRLLDRANDAVVMEVRSPVAAYWRANVLSDFTGLLWQAAPETLPLPPRMVDGSWTYAVPPTEDRGLAGRTVTQRFNIRATYTDHLFAGGSPSVVKTSLPLDLGATSAGALTVDPPRGPTMSYSVTSFVPDLGPSDLVGLGKYYPPDVARRYLQLPFPALDGRDGPVAEADWNTEVLQTTGGSEWLDLYELNKRTVGTDTDPYHVALAIQRYLRGRAFTYSLDPKKSSFTSPYAAFLFDTRTGYCQHFAGAMALLLRFNGIPARVAVGFTQGREEQEGVFVVRRHDAHAWVEAYFPGAGWATFDPTPGHQVPNAAGVAAGGAETGDAATGTTAAPDTQAAANRAGADRGGGADPGGTGGLVSTAPAGGSPWPWVGLLVAVLVGWPASRALVRRRGLRSSSLDERVRASAGLIYATLRDHGVDVPAAQTLEETARSLQDRFGVDAGDVPERLQAIAFGGRPATADDLAALTALRRRLRAGLRARDGRLARLAALYGLRRTSHARARRAAFSRSA